MTAATATPKPARIPAAAKFSAKVAASFAGDRPLNPEEYDLARFVVRRLDSARNLLGSLFGSADETDEFKAARKRRDDFRGDDCHYRKAALTDRDLLSPEELASYAGYIAFTVAVDAVEHAAWSMLRSAEIDLIKLVEALNHDLDGLATADAITLTLDGRRFGIEYLDADFDPRTARLIVSGAAQREGVDVLAN